MIALLVALLLGGATLAFVLYPIYHRSSQVATVTPTVRVREGDDVTEREQAARAALQEVELDYQLDNISEEDYNQLRERYVRRALIALKSRYQREQELDTVIEEQLRRMKEQEQDET